MTLSPMFEAICKGLYLYMYNAFGPILGQGSLKLGPLLEGSK